MDSGEETVAEEPKTTSQPAAKPGARSAPELPLPTPTSPPRPADDLSRAQADLQELLDANRRLRDAVQRKEDLLALCAHDVRALVELLLGQTRILLSGERGDVPEAQRRTVETIERQARRIRDVADDLAGLRSFEAGQVDLQREPTDLGRICREVADAFSAAARERGGALLRAFPPYPVPLPMDVPKIRKVLSTLLSEAILAAPPGANVQVTLEPRVDGAQVIFEALPHGAAPEAETPLLRQAALMQRTPRSVGSELGIAIARELVELHGGRLEVAAGPAGAPRLSVTLAASPAGLQPAEADARDGVRGRARLLVADDEDDARDALCLALEASYEVRTARDGEECLQIARADPPDLVLMDVVMPRMDGFTALEALRSDPRTAEVPVILVSARTDDLTKVKGLDLGAVDYLQKPFSERELRARIDRTLRLTQRAVQLRELAQTDPLTGLANLRAFRARLDEEMKRARRYRTPLTCVMADMDHLKPVNDELGHAAGDRAIAAVSDIVRAELRETDFGARYGGDEFVLLLPHTTAVEGRIFAERVCARLRETVVEAGGRRVPLVASFGVAELAAEAGEEAGDELVRRADEALYSAKRGGRGQVAVWSGPIRPAG